MKGGLGFKEEAFSLMKEVKGPPSRASARSKVQCEEPRRHLDWQEKQEQMGASRAQADGGAGGSQAW